MRKVSAEGVPCMYCDAPAIPGTYPPVCSEHKETLKKQQDELSKSASGDVSAGPRTLKGLDASGSGNG